MKNRDIIFTITIIINQQLRRD